MQDWDDDNVVMIEEVEETEHVASVYEITSHHAESHYSWLQRQGRILQRNMFRPEPLRKVLTEQYNDIRSTLQVLAVQHRERLHNQAPLARQQSLARHLSHFWTPDYQYFYQQTVLNRGGYFMFDLPTPDTWQFAIPEIAHKIVCMCDLPEWAAMINVCRFWYILVQPFIDYYAKELKQQAKLLATSPCISLSWMLDFILPSTPFTIADKSSLMFQTALFDRKSHGFVVMAKFVVGTVCLSCGVRYAWLCSFTRFCYTCELEHLFEIHPVYMQISEPTVSVIYNFCCWRWPQYYRQMHEPFVTEGRMTDRDLLENQFNSIYMYNSRNNGGWELNPKRSWHGQFTSEYLDDSDDAVNVLRAIPATSWCAGKPPLLVHYDLVDYVIHGEHLQRSKKLVSNAFRGLRERLNHRDTRYPIVCTRDLCHCKQLHLRMGVRKRFNDKYPDVYGYPLNSWQVDVPAIVKIPTNKFTLQTEASSRYMVIRHYHRGGSHVHDNEEESPQSPPQYLVDKCPPQSDYSGLSHNALWLKGSAKEMPADPNGRVVQNIMMPVNIRQHLYRYLKRSMDGSFTGGYAHWNKSAPYKKRKHVLDPILEE